MTVNSQLTEEVLGTRIAEKYRSQGFEVMIQPSTSFIPFDLGNYCPDIIARKSPDEGYIIELKNSTSEISVDRYREIAEMVTQHRGWRFLLITGEDVLQENAKDNEGLLTWEQIFQRKQQAQKFLATGEVEVAFLYLCGILEAALRQQAKNVAIPIERFPTNSLINHLYSQGELSMEQFDRARGIQTIRDRITHGYQSSDLTEPTKQLLELVNALLTIWRP